MSHLSPTQLLLLYRTGLSQANGECQLAVRAVKEKKNNKQMKNRGRINGCQQKRGKNRLLLWLNIRTIKEEEAIRGRLYWLCGDLCFYFKERHVSTERFWSPAPHQGCVWWRENSFQICIEFPFILYKRRRLWVKLHINSSRLRKKKKKKNMARRNPSGKSIIGDHACNDKSLGN